MSGFVVWAVVRTEHHERLIGNAQVFEEIKDAPDAKTLRPATVEGRVRFRHVSFAYTETVPLPLAMADAFKKGNMGIMDYYRMKNISADTDMRNNIGGGTEMPNLELVKLLLKKLGKPASLIEHVPDRPGHDRRYAISHAKLQSELGWEPAVSFADGLSSTIEWYLGNEDWARAIREGTYQAGYV